MKLTAKQVEALRTLDKKGPASPWDFGSTTVNRLREAGLIEDTVVLGTKRVRITKGGAEALEWYGRGNA